MRMNRFRCLRCLAWKEIGQPAFYGFLLVFFGGLLGACSKEFRDIQLAGTKPDLSSVKIGYSVPYTYEPDTLSAQCYTGEAEPTEYGFCFAVDSAELESQIQLCEEKNFLPDSGGNIGVIMSRDIVEVKGKYWRRFESLISFDNVQSGRLASPRLNWYLAAFVKNEIGISFGSIVEVDQCGRLFKSDEDGNKYRSVKIGQQCWTQSNLKVRKYRNGDNIPTGLSDGQWSTTSSGAYAIYNNDTVNDTLYGKLYNWYAVNDSRGLCPTGWHVPSDAEWTTLTDFLGGTPEAAGKMKSTATQPTPAGGWYSPNTDATNSSGFDGLPGGYRDSTGAFLAEKYTAYWWVSDDFASALFRSVHYNSSVVDSHRSEKEMGFSVRCLRD
jgi:uncharacterized protein (TIGR02145 family)